MGCEGRTSLPERVILKFEQGKFSVAEQFGEKRLVRHARRDSGPVAADGHGGALHPLQVAWETVSPDGRVHPEIPARNQR